MGRRITAVYGRGGLYVDGRPLPAGFTPLELLVAALTYGVGARHVDAGADQYAVECEVEGDVVKCSGRCIGVEEKCLVFKLASRGGLEFLCKA